MKEKITYDHLFFRNRWIEKYPNCDWVIIVLSVKWISPTQFCYKLSLFGLDLSIWFNREFIKIKNT